MAQEGVFFVMLNVYIDASPLVDPRPSGIGHLVAATAIALNDKLKERNDARLVLLVPRKNSERLDRWPELSEVKKKKFPFRTRVLNGLVRYNLLPWMDLFFGRGVYVFGNFKNWPLTKFSRSVTYIHDISFILYPDFAEPRNLSLLTQKLPRFIKRTNRIITISEASKKEIVEHYKLSSDDIDVVYCGVDTNLYKSYSEAMITQVKKKYNLKKDYLIYVGNIEPRKNLTTLVEGLSQMPAEIKKRIDLLVIGGNGWQNAPILSAFDAAAKTGVSIVRPGKYVEDEDVAVLISGATALVQPSVHEGFSLPPIEAVTAGTPALVSNIPVHREILGQSATFFDPKSPSDVSKKIRDTIKGVHGKNAVDLDKISTTYSWNVAADQLLEIIENLPSDRVVIKDTVEAGSI